MNSPLNIHTIPTGAILHFLHPHPHDCLDEVSAFKNLFPDIKILVTKTPLQFLSPPAATQGAAESVRREEPQPIILAEGGTKAASIGATRQQTLNAFHQVWTDLVSLRLRDPEMKNVFFIKHLAIDPATGRTSHGDIPCLVMHEAISFSLLAEDLRKKGIDLPLSLTNFKIECIQSPAWLPFPNDGKYSPHRMNLGQKGQHTVWLFRLDAFEETVKSILSPLERHVATPPFKGNVNGLVRADRDAENSIPLPPLHAGLIYPRDRDYLQFLSRYLKEAIHALGDDPDTYETIEARFQELRLLAHSMGRTDRELIESIITFKRLPGLPPEKLIEAVQNSLKHTAIAEVSSSRDYIAATATPKANPPAPQAAIRYTPEEAILAIRNLLDHQYGSESITPEFRQELLEIIHRSHNTQP